MVSTHGTVVLFSPSMANDEPEMTNVQIPLPDHSSHLQRSSLFGPLTSLSPPYSIPTTTNTEPILTSNAPQTLSALQNFIHDRYFETDSIRGTPATFMWFVEEVGELATALHKAAGEGGDTSDTSNLEEEFADVLAWLCTLANINNVDLTEAVRKKYFEGGGPKGHK